MKILLLSLLLANLTAVANANDLVKTQLLSDVSTIQPGKSFTVGVKLKIAPGWHVYWINPGDTGIPTKVTFELPEGFGAGELQFPTPEKFVMPGNITAFGYEDEVMLLATITPPADLKDGADVTIGAKTQWLVCSKDECVPGSAKDQVKLAVASAKPQAANEAEFAKWREQIPQKNADAKQEVQIDAPNGQFKSATGKIMLDWKVKLPEKVEWFPIAPDQLLITPTDIKTEGNVTTIEFKADALPGEKITDASFSSVVAYTIGGKRAGVIVPVKIVPGSNRS